jgi:hypothetical protein
MDSQDSINPFVACRVSPPHFVSLFFRGTTSGTEVFYTGSSNKHFLWILVVFIDFFLSAKKASILNFHICLVFFTALRPPPPHPPSATAKQFSSRRNCCHLTIKSITVAWRNSELDVLHSVWLPAGHFEFLIVTLTWEQIGHIQIWGRFLL